MVIRNAEPEDSPPLAQLARSLGQPLDAIAFSRDISVYSDGFFVAEVGGALCGYLIMRAQPTPSCVHGRSPIQLWRLFVSPEYQGKGVAALLMAQAATYARAERHDVIWLGTSADNARAIAFYRKSGFRPVGTAVLHHGHGAHEDLIMCCDTQ